MIDIHCHIVPGLDDGPSTMEESLAMARMAVADGTTGIICTPHWHPLVWPNEQEAVSQAVVALNCRVQNEGLNLTLWSGCELSLDPSLTQGLKAGQLTTLAGSRWILLELPPTFAPPGIDDFLWSVRQWGYEVILAHPERYVYVQQDPSRLLAWVEMGVTAQITAGSLLGSLGPEIASLCRLLIEHRLVHFLASDGHGSRRRRPLLGRAKAVLADMAGHDIAERLTVSHPWTIIRNQSLDLRDYAPRSFSRKKRPWYLSFLSRD